MDTSVALEKTVSFRTRDFWAESQRVDGSVFHVTRRGDGEDKVSDWWEHHRNDGHRSVFVPDDEDGIHLECADETEAVALIMQLQHEYNGVAL